ncbi:parvulin peptidyl-prolyl isomerase [Methylacidiphilum kamchatkense Kam1]|uniref:Parvulin peptidyl-prolyl isomerase n=1 Tax=Methylacidiphilum kamchatkense Kam1 TaxID=1202785 RepID=A0A0C1URU5_9BACT|nr:peptidylprolyl isomerase [Methylacidiphilum kamchatkense]KIE59024.1 parvulin peptidyl-prolyl isomerase [Methylacidiphilum kamchatkense Kam1]QDQ43078.1 peptidyl-prolyl cis-trans isomerase C/peptidyl-prolyl cis-trans isomerase SurA [Methylacidiphilum kamchatkense Kam1]
MVRSLLILFLCFFCLLRSLFSQTANDGIAAIVNDKVITFSQVRKQVEPNEAVLRETYQGPELVDRIKEARLSALRALIDRELIIQDFKSKKYAIPDSFIESRIRDIIRTQFDGDRIAFIRTLQANGVSEEQYKQQILEQIIVQAMRMKNVSEPVIISPYQIEKYYHDHISQFFDPPQVKLRIIFLQKTSFKEKRATVGGQIEEYDPAKETATELLSKLQLGADFAELARTYSEGPKRMDGGDLGWVTKDSLRPEIAEAAFSMYPGQTSGVIETVDGYYIIRLEDKRKGKLKPLSELRSQIEGLLIQEQRQKLQQQWLNNLKAKAFIKMF